MLTFSSSEYLIGSCVFIAEIKIVSEIFETETDWTTLITIVQQRLHQERKPVPDSRTQSGKSWVKPPKNVVKTIFNGDNIFKTQV